ncbi:MAG TPA: hypothetical protein VGK87_11300 [Anaerolineae bacterium]
MSQANSSDRTGKIPTALWAISGVVAALLALVATFLLNAVAQSPAGQGLAQTLNAMFGIDSGHATWFVTRAAGIIAYLLLWLSTAWGLGVSSKIFDRLLHRAFTFDFHEFISLLSIGFLVLHIVVLTGDKFMPYNLAQILIPFISPYRPVWVGVGVIAFWLILLVSITFYIRSKITMKTFRMIHLLSFVGYLTALAHSVYSGTDSLLPASLLMYGGTFLVIVFLTVYWLLTLRAAKQPKAVPETTAPNRLIAPVRDH